MASGSRCVLLFVGLASLVSAQDDDFERFPLSGGIADGVSVKVSFASFADMKSRLEFRTPDGTAVFKFELFPGIDAKIERSTSDTGSEVESWGGFPIEDASVPGTLEFLKTRHEWKVYINGAIYPWFGASVTTDQPVTHLVVFNGFADVEVVQDRPQCDTPCSIDECRTATGEFACVDADGNSVDSQQCKARKPSSNPLFTEVCTAGDEVSGLLGGHCCTGFFSLLESQITEGMWVQVAEVPDFVQSACTAVGEENCSSLVGKRARVNVKNSKEHYLEVWSPDESPKDDSAVYRIASAALFKKVPLVKNFTATEDEMNAVRMNINETNLILFDVPAATAGGFPDKWFFRFMHERTPGDEHDEEEWVYYKDDLFAFWGSKDHEVQAVVSDVEIDFPTCTDWLSPDVWEDDKGRTCADYADTEGEPLCTLRGIRTDKWNSIEPDTSFGKLATKSNLYAPKACCVCGGGRLGGNLFVWPEGWEEKEIELVQDDISAELFVA